jgi:hypothetical protein
LKFLLVKTPELIIEDIEGLTGSLPREDCYKISNTLDCVKGLAIKGDLVQRFVNLQEAQRGASSNSFVVHNGSSCFARLWAISYQRRSSQGSALNKERALKWQKD